MQFANSGGFSLGGAEARVPHLLVVVECARRGAAWRAWLDAGEHGCSGVVAEGLSLALHRARDESFDCVLLDAASAAPSIHAFLRGLRPMKSRLELPVIVLSPQESLGDKLSAFRGGASDFVVAPHEPEELMARIQIQTSLSRAHRHNAELVRQLQVLVDTDSLTGIANRRAFIRRLDEELQRAHRNQKSVGLLLLDADHFKRINDTYGHPAGDDVLVHLSRLLLRCARSYDLVARVGGEEFAVILPEMTRTGALGAAERIRQAVESEPMDGGGRLHVTVSIGVAHGPYHATDDAGSIFQRADRALYEAKHSGRNQVVYANEPVSPPAEARGLSRSN